MTFCKYLTSRQLSIFGKRRCKRPSFMQQKAMFCVVKHGLLWFIRSSGVCVEIKTEVAVKVVYLWLQQKTKHDEQHIPVSSTHGVSDYRVTGIRHKDCFPNSVFLVEVAFYLFITFFISCKVSLPVRTMTLVSSLSTLNITYCFLPLANSFI